MLCTLIALALLVVVMFYEQILDILSNGLGLISTKYYNYTESEFSSESLVTSYSEIISRIIYIALGAVFLFINNRKDKNKDEDYRKYYFFLLLEIILYLISFQMTNGERAGYYYRYIGMLYCIPAFPKVFKKDFWNRCIANTILIIIMFIFWYWKYPIQKNCETYPYKSSIIQWLND